MSFDFQSLVIRAFVLLTAMPIHECAHGWVANWLGDDTAEYEGRLTLNPFAHLDDPSCRFRLGKTSAGQSAEFPQKWHFYAGWHGFDRCGRSNLQFAVGPCFLHCLQGDFSLY